MNTPNYQLIKEGEWYYLAKKRFLLTNFINAVALNSALAELKESQHGILSAPSSLTLTPRTEKSYLSGPKPVLGDSTDETKQVKNIAPLSLNTKEKVFDMGSEIIGRSSPVTVKPPAGDSQSDAEKKKEERKSVDKRSSVFVEGVNLEGVSWLNRCKSKELVLKVKKASTDSLESLGRRKSNEKVEPNVSDKKEDTADTVGVEKHETKSKSDTAGIAENVSDRDEKDSSTMKIDSAEQISVGTKELKSSLADVADKKSASISLGPASGGETRRSSDTSDCKYSGDSPSIVSQYEGSLPSPLVTDVSICLTKTDGRRERYIAPVEGKLGLELDNSFDEDPDNEGILKRCSSFAGFRSDTPCGAIKSEDESLSQAHSPIKGFQSNIVGPVGRFRHFSAPLSGQGTPKSRVSTLPQTPSWMSSRGSFTEDGKWLLHKYLKNLFKFKMYLKYPDD